MLLDSTDAFGPNSHRVLNVASLWNGQDTPTMILKPENYTCIQDSTGSVLSQVLNNHTSLLTLSLANWQCHKLISTYRRILTSRQLESDSQAALLSLPHILHWLDSRTRIALALCSEGDMFDQYITSMHVQQKLEAMHFCIQLVQSLFGLHVTSKFNSKSTCTCVSSKITTPLPKSLVSSS